MNKRKTNNKVKYFFENFYHYNFTLYIYTILKEETVNNTDEYKKILFVKKMDSIPILSHIIKNSIHI